METTNKKECPNPKCKSLDVFNTRSGLGDHKESEKTYQVSKLKEIIYKCNKCREKFIFDEQNSFR